SCPHPKNNCSLPLAEHLLRWLRRPCGLPDPWPPLSSEIRTSQTVPFLSSNGGDSDGDGVVDTKDHCPNTPPNTNVNKDGCKDTDGDGVPDDKDPVTGVQDKCPTVKG